jgi:hypothetical protein
MKRLVPATLLNAFYDVMQCCLNLPGFSRHFRAVRNIAFHTLLAIAHY